MEKSMLDVAYEVVKASNGPISFSDILLAVGEKLKLDEDSLVKRAAQFYTNLLRDGRFVTLGENTWDLRIHHKFDKVHIDMNEIYREDDEEGEDSEDDEVIAEKEDVDLYDTLLEETEKEEEISGFGIQEIGDKEEE